MKLALFFVLLSISACSTLHPEAMSAAQLKEMVKDKNGSVICATVVGAWGTAKTVIVNLDSGVVRNGGIGVDQNCTVNLLNQQNVPQPSLVPVPPNVRG